jgi:hypothetical protein
MKVIIPIRKVTVFQAEDGRKVEEHKKTYEITEEVEGVEGEISEEETVFLGAAHIQTPMGTQEIKFPIEAKSVPEAFEKYMEELEKNMEEAKSTIVRASENDLMMLDDNAPSGNIILG